VMHKNTQTCINIQYPVVNVRMSFFDEKVTSGQLRLLVRRKFFNAGHLP
jgi:hypothetical protein